MTAQAIAPFLALIASVAPFSATPTAASPDQDDRRVDVRTPAIALIGTGMDIGLTLAEGFSATSFRLLTADGRELAAGLLEPGEELSLDNLRVGNADTFPLMLVLADDVSGAITIDPMVLPGWLSLLPALVAIALALMFKEVVVSLFFGVWFGALFVAGLNPIGATLRSVDTFIVPALADPDHAAILVFSALLLGMVGVMGRNGGTQGIVVALSPLATTPRRAQLATYLGGLAIFFDDYSNTLIIGNTMRPITDRMKVSREKLAYIVDSTAAPVAAIVFVSTWVGFQIGLIGDGLEAAAAQPGTSPELAAQLLAASPFNIFIHSIPYLFYPILTLVMVGLVIWTQRDFGPMWRAENRASRGEGLHRENAMLLVDTESNVMEPVEGAPHRWQNAALPVVTVFLVVVFGLYFDGRATLGRPGTMSEIFGEANAYNALLWGSLAGVLVAIALSVVQRIMSLKDSVGALIGGIQATLLAFLVLILAWSLGQVTEVLGAAEYLSGLLSGNLPVALLPAFIFIMAATIAFATGTSWATMAILIPLVIPLSVSLGGAEAFTAGASSALLLGTLASVLSGAIWGDHCSPISDTTVLSSMASACDHVDHVRTQMPYALLVGGIGILVGNLPTAYGMSPVFSYPLGALAIYLVLRFIGRPDMDSPQFARVPAEAGSGPPAI